MTKYQKYQMLPNGELSNADVIIYPVPYGQTVSGFQGTTDAPQAILKASEQIEYYEEIVGWSPMKYLNICVHEPFVLKGNTEPEFFHDQLTKTIREISGTPDQLFIGLGGEHSISPSLINARMSGPGTVVFLDAHADLRLSYNGSKFNHACPANRIRESGHKMIMVGVRSFFEEEVERINSDPDIQLYSAQELQNVECRNRLLQNLSAVEGPVWLSVDLDVFDPSVVPGVGTPQPGGLDWYTVVDIVRTLLFNSRIELYGVDMVELIPESSGISQITAAKLIQKVISFWGKANQYDEGPAHGSQTYVNFE